jgi:NAD(P)-dependent dehydrogenase (short-subunit alcohol dehydrogenase family)
MAIVWIQSWPVRVRSPVDFRLRRENGSTPVNASSSTPRGVALVTGANRGLGFATCRRLGQLGFAVVLTARDESRAVAAAKVLREEGLDVRSAVLDVASDESIRSCLDELSNVVPQVDVLVNNAGVLFDWESDVFELEAEVLARTLSVNLYGPLRMCQALVPGMRTRGRGHVVNVSSDSGQLETMSAISPAYSISKVALNAVTRIVAAAAGPRVKVNSIHPGWVATDMGGEGADTTPEQAARHVADLATLPADGPTGGFYFAGEPFPW